MNLMRVLAACFLCVCLFTVEDQKELPSPVNPELRHKEVQMNFFNQLTSVFNPDLTLLASPSSHTQVSPAGRQAPGDT